MTGRPRRRARGSRLRCRPRSATESETAHHAEDEERPGKPAGGKRRRGIDAVWRLLGAGAPPLRCQPG